MTVTACLTGVDRVRRKLRAMAPRQRREVGNAVSQSLVELADAARMTVATIGDDTSAVDTDALAASIRHAIDPDRLSGSVGTDSAAGIELEFGSMRTPARPWLGPTFDRLAPRARKRIVDAVRRSLRGGA